MENDEVIPSEIAQAVADPHAYQAWDDWHAKLRTLRATQPFARGDLPGYDRFWVASKLHDVQEIARQPQLFRSGYGALETTEQMEVDAARGAQSSSIVFMNAPNHMKYRLLTQNWFQPKNIRALDERIRKLARSYIDRVVDRDGNCEFWETVSKPYTLQVIMSILGIPPEHEDVMTALTAMDSAQQVDVEPEQLARYRLEKIQESWKYFGQVTEARRKHPEDDLASVIANSLVNGAPISEHDTGGYFTTILVAGHETTTASLAGAIWALAERPEVLAKVQANPALIDNLIEESVRWTTPVYQFTRTAAQDTEFSGAKVREGDRIVLSYLSANRDEDVYSDPFEFRVDRSDYRHVGFSYGAHMCLGMHLARMEMRIMFEELLPRIRKLELTGEPRRRLTNFVGGPEYVPVQFTLE